MPPHYHQRQGYTRIITMITETTFETKVIKGRSNNDIMCRKFMVELQSAIQDGWVLDETAKGVYNRMVFSRSLVRVPLMRAVIPAQRNLLEDPKSSKPELLEYAASKNIEVPKDKASPAAIKKFIKDELEKRLKEDLESVEDETEQESLEQDTQDSNQENVDPENKDV